MKAENYPNVPKTEVGEMVQTSIDDGAIEVTAKIDSGGSTFTVTITK